MTVAERLERIQEIESKLEMIARENTGKLDDDTQKEWDDLVAEREDHEAAVAADAERREYLRDIQQGRVPGGEEAEPEPLPRDTAPAKRDRSAAGLGGSRLKAPTNFYDMAAYRPLARTIDDLPVLYKEGAKRAIDEARFPHQRAKRADVQEHIENLIETRDDAEGQLALRIISTGSPLYRRAFTKKWTGGELTPEESRALSLTTTAGGFAVPFTLDATVIPTSSGAVNPIRAISRLESITTNEWRGVSSAGVVASYAAEAAEATDDAPVLAQPTIFPERAHVFIPFSWEIGQDWSGLEAEMARMVQFAKDDLEASRFFHGLGHTANQPEGVLVGGTAVVATAAATALAEADLYSLEEALPPRFRPRAVIVGNRKQFNRVRAMSLAEKLWVRIGESLRANEADGRLPEGLLGYPTYESSEMVSTLTSASSILIHGDFSHYCIVERIGMSASVLPHLLGSNRRPTGQSGLYFFWRNSAEVLAWQAFRTLKVT